MSTQSNCVDMFVLARFKPISSLLEEQISELADTTRELALPKGHQLFEVGEQNNDLIYLVAGEVEIQPRVGERYVIKSDTPESRQPLSDHDPQHATATSLTPVLYVRINRDLVDTMLTWAQSASSEREEVIMSGDNIVTIDTGMLKSRMQQLAAFRQLPAANIDKLLEKMEPLHVSEGEVIVRQGDEGEYFYLIEKGEALVTRTIEQGEGMEDSIEMAHLDEGAFFGEAALISDAPRNATVSMETDGILLRLKKGDFLSLMQEPSQNWLTAKQAMKKIKAGAQWIDARAVAEFLHGHLPDAINIPLNEAHRWLQRLERNKDYICYCQTGRRSSAEAFVLSQYGFNVGVLRDGLPSLDGLVEVVSGDADYSADSNTA